MPETLDNVTPGQDLRITITSEPRAAGARKTIARLMRQDPSIKKALKNAQESRMANLYVRSRGKRPWAVRRKAARYARVATGESWTMRYIPQLASDLRSVSKYLEIAKA